MEVAALTAAAAAAAAAAVDTLVRICLFFSMRVQFLSVVQALLQSIRRFLCAADTPKTTQGVLGFGREYCRPVYMREQLKRFALDLTPRRLYFFFETGARRTKIFPAPTPLAFLQPFAVSAPGVVSVVVGAH